MSFVCILHVQMNSKIKIIVTLVILSTIGLGQLRSALPNQSLPVNTQGLSHARGISLFDSNRLTMNHSFGISMSTFGNQSLTMGAYTNHLNYIIKDNLSFSTQISLTSPMGGINPYAKNGFGSSQLFYNAGLDYKPSENLLFKFSLNNYPRYGYTRPYSGFYPSR